MRLREITPQDYAGCNALWEKVWWPTRSAAGWAWLAENPALKATGAPLGWVIEDEDGGLAAVLGALPQAFWRGDDIYYGLSGHSLVVQPRLRGASRPLIERILAQPGFALCYTLNANALSHRLYGRFGFVAPQAVVADRKLAWVIDPLACLAARGLRQGLRTHPDLARRVGERLHPGPRLWDGSALRLPDGVAVIRPDAAYDDFWRRLRGEGRWLADRSARTLNWRLSDPDLTLPPVLLGYVRGAEVLGYSCAMFVKENPLEPVVLEIVDIQALAGAADAMPSLLKALTSVARQRGAAKLRLGMYGPELYERLGAQARSARLEGGWSHAHLFRHSGAPDLNDWSPTPFDGDMFMSQRAVPPPIQGPDLRICA